MFSRDRTPTRLFPDPEGPAEAAVFELAVADPNGALGHTLDC